VYVKLCRAIDDQCILQRSFYLPPGTALFVDKLVDGNYRLVFAENRAPAFATGQSATIRINAGRAHELNWVIPAVAPVSAPLLVSGFGAATREMFDAVR
jgi:hypothetical protein